ncbi:separase [Sarracenia purpurea var. burkii]
MLYKSAWDRLKSSEWKNSVYSPENRIVHDALVREVGVCASCSSACGAYHSDIKEFPTQIDVPETRIETKKFKKTKKTSKPLVQGQCSMAEHNTRMTRFRYRSLRNSENVTREVLVGLAKDSNNEQHSTDALDQTGPLSEIDSSVNSGCKITCLCNEMKCWYCLHTEVVESGCINNFVQMKWEFARRRLLLKLLSGIGMVKIISWLMLAFVLSREVPILVQKVSRLLAAIFVISASTEIFSSNISPCKALSESHWASYFHQASLGTHLNHKFLSSLIGKQKVQDPMDVEVSCLTGSGSSGSEMLNLLRFFFAALVQKGLPCTTIICLSLLGGAFASLVTEWLGPCAHAWIFLSRLNSNSQPVVIFLPVDSILEAATNDDKSSSRLLFEEKNIVKSWHCPWGSTVVDEVAPVFRMILEDNYLSSIQPLEDSKENRSLWWMQRKSLDQRLGKFLRDLEDSWFGPWKFLLLGELCACKHQESIQKRLMHILKIKCEVDAHESLCFIGGVGLKSLSKRAFDLKLEASNEIEEKEGLNRDPVILVLDFDVQMLPWENLPILRNLEVYRMPSISSISATLDKCHRLQEQVGRNPAIFPLIDPLDAFYLLNPSGDLSNTQVKFEDYFREKKFEGKAGMAPTIEELAVALRSRDLFIYFGHGSGIQYIPEQDILGLENCAAILLMGCSSGSLVLNGCYAPEGAPLCYLLAGSPVIVANLWEVTDKDIDRFGKAMLDCCLNERLAVSMGCVPCNLFAEKFKSMKITGINGNAKKKKTSSKNFSENFDINDRCNHRPNIGSFMGQAREACMLPFLIGAAPVCYGVPTGIFIKKDL